MNNTCVYSDETTSTYARPNRGTAMESSHACDYGDVFMACILLWSSAVRVHDSQAYRKMNATRERISCTLELREILLSSQTGFNLVNAAVVCAILGSVSDLKPA